SFNVERPNVVHIGILLSPLLSLNRELLSCYLTRAAPAAHLRLWTNFRAKRKGSIRLTRGPLSEPTWTVVDTSLTTSRRTRLRDPTRLSISILCLPRCRTSGARWGWPIRRWL